MLEKKIKKTVASLIDQLNFFDDNHHKISQQIVVKDPRKLQKHLLNRAKAIFFKEYEAEKEAACERYVKSGQEVDKELIESAFKKTYEDNFDNIVRDYLAKEALGEKIGALFNDLFPGDAISEIVCNYERVKEECGTKEYSNEKHDILLRTELAIKSIDDKTLNYIKSQIKVALYDIFIFESIDSFSELIKGKDCGEISKIRQAKISDEMIFKFRNKYMEFKNSTNFHKFIESKFKQELDKAYPDEFLLYFAKFDPKLNSTNPSRHKKAHQDFVSGIKKQILSVALFSSSRDKIIRKILDLRYRSEGQLKIDSHLTDDESRNIRLICFDLDKFKEKEKFSSYDLFKKIEDFSLKLNQESRDELHKFFRTELKKKLKKRIFDDSNLRFSSVLNDVAKSAIDDMTSRLSSGTLSQEESKVFKKFFELYDKVDEEIYSSNGIFEYALRKQNLFFCRLFEIKQFKKTSHNFCPKLLEQALDLYFQSSNSSNDREFIKYLIRELNIEFDGIFIREKIKNNEILDYYQELCQKLPPDDIKTYIIENFKLQISSQIKYDFDTAEAFLKIRDQNEFFKNIQLNPFTDKVISKLLYPENFLKYPLLVKFFDLKMTFESEQLEKYDLNFLKKFHEISRRDEFCRKVFIEKNDRGESLFVRIIKSDEAFMGWRNDKFEYLCDVLLENREFVQKTIESGDGFCNPQHNNWGPFEYAQDFLISSMRDNPKNFKLALSNYKKLENLDFLRSPNATNTQSFSELKRAYGEGGGISLMSFARKLREKYEDFFKAPFRDFLNILEIQLPYGDLSCIEQIENEQKNHPSIFQIETFNKTPLHFAVENFDYERCKNILSQNIKDINATSSEITHTGIELRNKPIHLIKWGNRSCKQTNLNIFKMFVEYGVDASEVNGVGNSALMMGLQYGIKEVISIYLDSDKGDLEVFKKQNIFGETVCHKLAMWSHADLFIEVAGLGCDVWLSDRKGDTCVDYVAKNIEDGNHKEVDDHKIDTSKTNNVIIKYIFETDAENSYLKVEEFLDGVIKQNRVKLLTYLIESFPMVFALINERSNISRKIQENHVGRSKMLTAYEKVAKKSSIIKVFDGDLACDQEYIFEESASRRSNSPIGSIISSDGSCVVISRPHSPSSSV